MKLPARKILIIDASPEYRVLIFSLLKEIKGYEISLTEAKSGAEGLELCRAEKFDCVLVDAALPDINGIEVLASLENEHGKNMIPVVIMCVVESVENILQIFDRGAHGFLLKGKFSSSNLSRAVENAIEKADLRRAKDRAEAQMRQIASIVEYSDDAIISQNLDGTILSWNKGAEKIYDYSAQEIIGQNIRKIFPPDHLEEEEMIVGRILNNESFIHYETIRIKKDGSQIPVSLTVSPIKDTMGNIIAISKIARDISSRQLAEQKIQESNSDFQALIKATTQSVWTTSTHQRDLAGAQWWMDLTGQTVEDLDDWKWLKALHPDDRDPAKKAWSDAFNNKNLFDVEYRVKNRQGIYQHFAVRGVPVFNDDGSLRKWIGTFTDITKRKVIEEDLKENEERYRHLFNDNPFPLVIYDFDTLKITEVNEAACELYGYTHKEFLELSLSDFGSKSDINAIVEKVSANQESLVSYGAWEHKKKDGTTLFVETTSHKLNLKDENLRIVLVKDISDRKKAEEELREAEERFRATFEQAAVGIAHVALDGKWLLVNERLCEIVGYTKEELSKLTFLDITYPEDLEKDLSLVRRVLSGEIKNYSMEKRYFRKDKSIIWVNLTVSLVQDEQENPKYFISVVEDINQRKKAESERQKWADAFENCAHGIAMGDPQTNTIIACNSAFAGLFGKEKNEIENAPILSVYNPKSFENVKAKMVEADAKGFVRYEALMKRKDGSDFSSQMDVVSIRDDSGKVIYRVATMQDITIRKQAENDLRESEGKLRLFVESAPVSVAMFDREMNYLVVSPRWIQDFNLESNIIGKNHYQIFPEMPDYWKGIHQKALAGSVEKSEQDKFVRGGSVTWLRWEVRPWFNSSNEIGGIIIFSEDITERKRIEENLRFEKERFEAIASVAPTLICSFRMSPDGTVTMPYASPAIENIYGLAADEVRENGNLILERISAKDIERVNESISKSMLTMKIWHDSFRFEHPNKGEVWIEGFSAPVAENDGSITWHGIIIDITDRKKYEQEIVQFNESLEQKVVERTAELKAINKELEAFSYSVSHDLRAPLRAIDGFSLALSEDYNDKFDLSGQDYLRRIRQASQQMAELIDNMLLLSRVTRREIKRTDLNLSKLFAEIAENVKKINPRDNVLFEIEENIYARGDEGLIKIALENLIGNAYKFTSKKDFAKIIFGQTKTENGNEFFIKDNGAGFNMNYADKLFGAFQRLHRTDEFQGTGIGLATVQRVINKHGGKIRAEGKVGEGASFYFTL